MKYHKIIVDFRREYKKLCYPSGEQNLGTLYKWVCSWCEKRAIPKRYAQEFYQLAIAYFDKEYYEEKLVRRILKKLFVQKRLNARKNELSDLA